MSETPSEQGPDTGASGSDEVMGGVPDFTADPSGQAGPERNEPSEADVSGGGLSGAGDGDAASDPLPDVGGTGS